MLEQPTIQTRPWDVAEHLETEEDMAAYLEAALADGDIGAHFPPSDAQHANRDSADRQVPEFIGGANFLQVAFAGGFAGGLCGGAS